MAKAATTTSQRGTTPPAGRPGEAKPEPDPATAAGPIYQLKDLPEGIRRELPALSVGGSAYSKSPADRLLIVHGQVFHEGAALAPGLRLEEIRHKSAVLSYKGYRYEITF